MIEPAYLPLAPGPRLRPSPFFDSTRRYGCNAYTVYNHMLLPLYYESPEADFWRLVNDVTLWDVAGERQVEITGPDAARLTQLLTPRNISGCEVGQCKYVLITAEDGGVINDPLLLKLAESHYWLSLADSDVLLWAKGVAAFAGMNVRIREPDVSPLQIQGPKSLNVMTSVFGDWVRELEYFRFRQLDHDGMPLVISRTGWSGERGYEIFLRDGSFGDTLWERVMEAGRAHGIGPGGPSTIRRIEAAMLSYGADMTLEENPFEIGLGRLVSLDQPADFIGKPALRKIAEKGVSRRLVGVEIDGEPLSPNRRFWPVLDGEGRWIGRISSSVWSPRLKKNIALGMVKVGHERVGTKVEVDADGTIRVATVVETPFHDPGKEIVKAR
ncbi:MAG TPA: dimethylsulfoniopropionate demethylase [Gammaproteobacteria bacterium]|nr:dimethylsulfoniopropionate demethylase [Gammaproteobacteria bacterium]